MKEIFRFVKTFNLFIGENEKKLKILSKTPFPSSRYSQEIRGRALPLARIRGRVGIRGIPVPTIDSFFEGKKDNLARFALWAGRCR
jgi:hypothetical protein